MNKIVATFPFLLYIAGLGALLVSDLLVTTFLPDQQVAQWAAIRSFIGISSVLCLVGLDQVLVRTPESSFRILGLLLVQIPLISSVIAFAYRFYDSETNSVLVFLVSVGTAGSLALFQFFRTHGKRFAAQWSQQAWKILVGIYFAITVLQGSTFSIWLAVTFVTILGLVLSMIPLRSKLPKQKDEPKSYGWIYSIGFRSLTTSLLLALSIYAEQFVVGSETDVSQSAYYFAHTTYFLLPASVLNGYLAFTIAPWLRENKDLYLHHKSKHALRWIAILVVYSFALSIFGYVAWKLMRSEGILPSLPIQIAMLVSGMARTAYTFPAGFVGAFGTAKIFDGWIIFQTISFGLAIAVYWLLSRQFNLDVIIAISIASTFNWVTRMVVGFSLVHKLEKSLA